MNPRQDIRRIERLLKGELLNPSKNPRIEQGLSMAIEGLSPAKSLYADALEKLQELKMAGVGMGEDRETIEASIEAARSGYIGVDQIIDNLYGIKQILTLAPINLSPVRKEGRRNG